MRVSRGPFDVSQTVSFRLTKNQTEDTSVASNYAFAQESYQF